MSTALTVAQWSLLGRVCKTNGGGIPANDERTGTIIALARRGLIQGKGGQQHKLVHTAEGLALWRAHLAEQVSA